MALDYDHPKGGIYRDINPKNILIQDDLEAKITDLGVAVVSYLQEGMGPSKRGRRCIWAPNNCA